jgi:hypothetical protein
VTRLSKLRILIILSIFISYPALAAMGAMSGLEVPMHVAGMLLVVFGYPILWGLILTTGISNTEKRVSRPVFAAAALLYTTILLYLGQLFIPAFVKPEANTLIALLLVLGYGFALALPLFAYVNFTNEERKIAERRRLRKKGVHSVADLENMLAIKDYYGIGKALECNDDPEVRRAALDMLSDATDQRVVRSLRWALEDADDGIRFRAAYQLFLWCEEDGLEILISKFEKLTHDEKLKVVDWSNEFDNEQTTIAVLRRAAEDYDEDVQQKAHEYLKYHEK